MQEQEVGNRVAVKKMQLICIEHSQEEEEEEEATIVLTKIYRVDQRIVHTKMHARIMHIKMHSMRKQCN